MHQKRSLKLEINYVTIKLTNEQMKLGFLAVIQIQEMIYNASWVKYFLHLFSKIDKCLFNGS